MPNPQIYLPPALREKLQADASRAAEAYANALLNLGVVVPPNSPIRGERSFGDCTDWAGNTETVRTHAKELFHFLSHRGQTFAEYRRERALAQPLAKTDSNPVDAFHRLISNTEFFHFIGSGSNGDILLERIDPIIAEHLEAKKQNAFLLIA